MKEKKGSLVQNKFRKAMDLIKDGLSVTQACKDVKLQKSQFYYWRAREEKPSSNVKVVTYDGSKVKKSRAAKTKRIGNDLFFVMGDAETVARFYRSLKE